MESALSWRLWQGKRTGSYPLFLRWLHSFADESVFSPLLFFSGLGTKMFWNGSTRMGKSRKHPTNWDQSVKVAVRSTLVNFRGQKYCCSIEICFIFPWLNFLLKKVMADFKKYLHVFFSLNPSTHSSIVFTLQCNFFSLSGFLSHRNSCRFHHQTPPTTRWRWRRPPGPSLSNDSIVRHTSAQRSSCTVAATLRLLPSFGKRNGCQYAFPPGRSAGWWMTLLPSATKISMIQNNLCKFKI